MVTKARERNRKLRLPLNYVANLEPEHFDDRSFEDEWQKEVYESASKLFSEQRYDTVCDIGCGSGFKLVKYFGAAQTIGYELEPCLSHLRSRWPEREWRDAVRLNADDLDVDLVVCSDVIEHLLEPDRLLSTLARSSANFVVISTPELGLLARNGFSPQLGPPTNPHHVNEWTVRRFASFVGSYLDVISQTIVNRSQCTQVIVARPRRQRSREALSDERH